MDVAQRVPGRGDVCSSAVRLRPDWRHRLLIILCGMLAICVASAAWVVLAGGQSQVPQSPEAIPLVVVGALDPYADAGLGPARAIMSGAKVDDMVGRLRRIREHLVLVHTYYEMQAELPVVNITGDTATITAQVYDLVETPAHNGDMYQTPGYAWTFRAVRSSFPQPGWFLNDFTAPDECHVYVECSPPAPAPSPSAPPYLPVYLSCAAADPQGFVDTVVSYTIYVGADGVADFSQAWKSVNVSCTTDPLHPQPVVSSPVERAAVAASGTGTAAATMGTLYADCAARFDLSLVAGPGGDLGSRVGEFRGVLVLCPRHPDAQAIRAAVDRG
jgi:hypothetical protein